MGKRKLFTGNKPVGGSKPIKSRRMARVVTGRYHELRNAIEALRRKMPVGANTTTEIEQLEAELEAMGGTDAYQKASVISTNHFKTSRWVLAEIAKHMDLSATKTAKLQVLEVGAINTQLQSASHLSVRAIDVNSQDPKIEELDFFDLKAEQGFDCVVCSMVINCVTDNTQRGEMLVRLCLGHLKSEKSLLLLALPSRCINSIHVGADDFEHLLSALGMDLLDTKITPKITFYSLRPWKESSGEDYRVRCKSLLKCLSHAQRDALAAKFRTRLEQDPCRTSADFRLYLPETYWP